MLSLFWHSRRSFFRLSVLHASTFLPPFAPRPLRRFSATMRASDSCSALLSPHRSPCFTCTAFLTIPSPPTPCAPIAAFARYPSARWLSRLRRSRLHHSLAGSPDTQGRFEFVILRTGRSPPVALHPASRRRSYSRLQAGACMPGEDFHLSVRARSQAHWRGRTGAHCRTIQGWLFLPLVLS